MNKNSCVFCGWPSEKQLFVDNICISDNLCSNCFEIYKLITARLFYVISSYDDLKHKE